MADEIKKEDEVKEEAPAVEEKAEEKKEEAPVEEAGEDVEVPKKRILLRQLNQ